jgi:type I restriction enzyme S subunit
MIDGLKPYPAMKDSGVQWLGQVPAHWEVRRLKRICRLAYGDALATDVRQDGAVPVYGSNGRVGAHSVANTKAPCIVVGRKGSFGKVNFSYQPVFAIDTTFFVDSRFTTADMRWLYLLLGWLQLDKVSKDSAVPGLDREDAYKRIAAVPPLPEQAAIVRFLDDADRRIRRYIRAKQKLIKLLEEQKQAIIHRAVTRGLDPNARLKPSGVEWLGDVPAHWELRRLKDVAGVQTGLTLGKAYRGSSTKSYPYLRVANVQVGRVDLRHVKHIDVPEREALGAMLRSGDVLMTEGGDIDKLGRGCVWHAELPVCLHQNHVFAVRCDRTLLLPEFLVGLMASQHGRTYFQLTAKQTTNLAATNSTTLRAFPILRPPLDEQQAIIDDIARQTVAVSKAVEDAQGAISLLREYRTRLIADVVTGKLDVREAAARLPEEAEELEPLDETEALGEMEGESAADDLEPESQEAEA